MARRGNAESASDLIGEGKSLDELREASAQCKACDLWKIGTQTVFGDGPTRSKIFLIGEQPGNDEDLTGQPFVGPSGRILDKALEAAGIPRDATYVTNVVKHFRWEPRGKRRIHKKPSSIQIAACSPWLEAELELLNPRIIVCLGATAAQALLGRTFRLTLHRGEVLSTSSYKAIMATIHPSAILRLRDEEERHKEMDRLIDDLKVAARFS